MVRGARVSKGLPETARNTRPHRAKHPAPETRTMPMAVAPLPVEMAAMTSIQISSFSMTWLVSVCPRRATCCVRTSR